MTLKLSDLIELCKRYVPRASRHANSFPLTKTPKWWPAHELAHLLTVPFANIGKPMFGLVDGDLEPLSPYSEHEVRCRELAAMRVSAKLLAACGRTDLADAEHEETDSATVNWNDRGRVHHILRAHRCLRIPRTRRALETKIVRVLIAAAHIGRPLR